MASGNLPVSLGAAGPFLLYCPQLRKQQSYPTLGNPLGAGLFPRLQWLDHLRFSKGSKVLWGFLSFFFCLFLDKTSVVPSSSSRAQPGHQPGDWQRTLPVWDGTVSLCGQSSGLPGYLVSLRLVLARPLESSLLTCDWLVDLPQKLGPCHPLV